MVIRLDILLQSDTNSYYQLDSNRVYMCWQMSIKQHAPIDVQQIQAYVFISYFFLLFIQSGQLKCSAINYRPLTAQCEIFDQRVKPNGIAHLVENDEVIYGDKLCLPGMLCIDCKWWWTLVELEHRMNAHPINYSLFIFNDVLPIVDICSHRFKMQLTLWRNVYRDVCWVINARFVFTFHHHCLYV